jgi:HEAT repeat protein
MAVLDVLKKIGSSHVEGVIGMLYDENEDIRVYGCEVLSFLKDPRAIPALIDKLKNDADNVRNAACVALGDFDDERSVHALIDALYDDEWIAFSAIYSIGQTKQKTAAPRLLDFFKTAAEELSIAACEVLIEYDDDNILNEIFDTLKGWDRPKRNTYLKTILEKGNEEMFRKLKLKIGDELYEHLLSNVRYENQHSLEILHMLSNFKNEDTCNAILGVLKVMDSENEDYQSVLDIFASMKDVWSPLINSYAGEEENLLPLIKACKVAGVRIDEKLLLNMFLASSIDVKREIITGLPDIMDGNSSQIVKEAITDTDGHIKGDAVDVVGRLNIRELEPEIVDIARQGFADVRTKALKTLIKLDEKKAIELIIHFVFEGSIDDKKVYLSATQLISGENNFPYIEKLVFDPDDGIRRNTIGVLGNFVDNVRYKDLLEKVLSVENIPHEALKVVKDKKLDIFKNRLIEIFVDHNKGMWTRYYALSALGVFEDNALFNIFVKGLSDENSLITIGCIRALADLNDRKALEYIMPFADNQNEDIKSAAQSVLEKLERV